MESKQEICEALLVALQLTDDLRDLSTLEYDEWRGAVKATFDNGNSKIIDARVNSGVELILAIVWRIL